MLKPTRLAVLFSLVISFCNCSPSKVATGNGAVLSYLPSPIVIDGQAEDWKKVPFILDPGTTLRYAITNDSDNLYVCLTTASPGLEDKIFRMGLKMYFDTTAEKKEAIGIHYPMPIDGNAMQAIASAGATDTRTSAENYRHFIRLQENQYELFGFPAGDGLNGFGSQDYVKIGFTLNDNDVMVYEVGVPLKSIFGGTVPASAFNTPMSLGLYIEGVPRSADPNAPVASEIGMPGANMTGARINMGKGGGLQRNPYGYTSEIYFKPQRAWIKFTLAKK